MYRIPPRRDENIKITVVFDCGFLGMSVPFWMPYPDIIRDAQQGLFAGRKVVRIEDDDRNVLWSEEVMT